MSEWKSCVDPSKLSSILDSMLAKLNELMEKEIVEMDKKIEALKNMEKNKNE